MWLITKIKNNRPIAVFLLLFTYINIYTQGNVMESKANTNIFLNKILLIAYTFLRKFLDLELNEAQQYFAH